MVHLPASLLLLLSLSTAFALPAPVAHRPARRDINISHTSRSNGTAVTHTIDSATLDPALKAAIDGSDLNINIVSDRKRSHLSHAPRSAGISNSTINLTVIGSTKKLMRKRSEGANKMRRSTGAATAKVAASPSPVASPSKSTPIAEPSPAHHNIHIDASSTGTGMGGGIQNSTININLNSRAMRRRKVNLGDHSVLVDTSAASSSSSGGGIEDSTVHVNILPARALDKTVGEHSVIIDASHGNQDGITSTGDHSAVVDSSSSSASNSSSSTTGIKGSTINLTVVSPPSEDEEEPATPAAARLVRRAESSPAWAAAIKHRSYTTATNAAAIETVVDVVVVEEPLRFEVRRSHASSPSRFGRKQ